MTIVSHFEPVGPDRIERHPEGLVIHSPGRMEGWVVREFCKVPIWVDGQKFVLIEIVERKAGGCTYHLAPWREGLSESPNHAIFYDATYVRDREADERTRRRTELFHAILMPVYPLLGLLWSVPKAKVATWAHYQVDTMTGVSVVFLFAVGLVEAVYFGFLHTGIVDLLGGPLWVDFIFVPIVVIDSIFRYHHLLRRSLRVPGFYEWLFWWRFREDQS